MFREDIPPQLVWIEDDGRRLWISIRIRKRRDAIAFLVMWLAVWMFIAAMSTAAWVKAGAGLSWWLVIAAALLATNLGVTAFTLLYYWRGRDVLIVEPGRLVLREEVFGRGLGRTFTGDDLDFPELADRDELRQRGLSPEQIDDNSLWLEHRDKIIPVGAGLTLEHADRLRRRVMMRVRRGPE
jgi:hypothetical protein